MPYNSFFTVQLYGILPVSNLRFVALHIKNLSFHTKALLLLQEMCN